MHQNTVYMDIAEKNLCFSNHKMIYFSTTPQMAVTQAGDGALKGIAYKYCSGCGEEVITGHVHDFGTIEKTIYSEKIICECGMSFSAGKDYTALESWESHVESYVSHGYPRREITTAIQPTQAAAHDTKPQKLVPAAGVRLITAQYIKKD